MKSVARIFFIALAVAAWPASAEDEVDTEAIRLAFAISAHGICESTLDNGIAERIIRDHIAKGAAITPQMVLVMMRWAARFARGDTLYIEVQGRNTNTSTAKALDEYCAEKARDFGPNGTSIPGILLFK